MFVPKVPNDAWDSKLQGIEVHNETSINYVMSRTQKEQTSTRDQQYTMRNVALEIIRSMRIINPRPYECIQTYEIKIK